MKKSTYAFIDSQNLNLAIKELGWELDFARFRVFLKRKYGANRAYIFIGYMKENEGLYKRLRRGGYTIIFKPTLQTKRNRIKGNCDAELVMHCMLEYKNFEKAIIVSGDGDFHCLIDYLSKKNKLLKIGIPKRTGYSCLLKKFRKYFFFVSDLKNKIEYKKR